MPNQQSKPLLLTVTKAVADDDGVTYEERQVEVTMVADVEAGVIRYIPVDPHETFEFTPLPLEDVPTIIERLTTAMLEAGLS